MSCYLRGIDLARWQSSTSFDDLPGEAITLDLHAENNEWSVFRTDDPTPETCNCAAGFLLMKTPKILGSGLNLFSIPESELHNLGVNVSKEVSFDSEFNVEHRELAGVDGKSMILLTKLILQNKNNSDFVVADFDSTDLWELFKKHYSPATKTAKMNTWYNFFSKGESSDPAFQSIFSKEISNSRKRSK